MVRSKQTEFESARLSPESEKILCYLDGASIENEWVRVSYLPGDLEIAQRTIQSHINELIADGLVETRTGSRQFGDTRGKGGSGSVVLTDTGRAYARKLRRD